MARPSSLVPRSPDPDLTPPALAFTPAERRLIQRLRTPDRVQAWLNALPYNTETDGETQRSFRGVVRTGRAHCMEAAVSAAVILEQHGYPPLVISFESADHLDHVIYVYRTARGWGSVARSRDPGLHGRKPLFVRPRELALSYCDPYVDYTGHVTAYAVIDLRTLMGGYDWRLSPRNLWEVEQRLIDYPHRPIRLSLARIERLRTRYREYREQHDDHKPLYYDRRRWTPIPREFVHRTSAVGLNPSRNPASAS
jgi:hypothetical protein